MHVPPLPWVFHHPSSRLQPMPDPSSSRRPPSVAAGLCETCHHRRLVPNTRGSVFSLCMLSRTDPSYPRYPRLPVLACPGYERTGP